MADELTPLNDALEPLAQLAPSGSDWSAYAAVSAAISAKRQADALERIAAALSGFDFAMVDNWAQTIAWNAGRSFESGRRQ